MRGGRQNWGDKFFLTRSDGGDNFFSTLSDGGDNFFSRQLYYVRKNKKYLIDYKIIVNNSIYKENSPEYKQ